VQYLSTWVSIKILQDCREAPRTKIDYGAFGIPWCVASVIGLFIEPNEMKAACAIHFCTDENTSIRRTGVSAACMFIALLYF